MWRPDITIIIWGLLLVQGPVLENDYVTVHRNAAPCASAGAGCGDRVIVALGAVDFEGTRMERGDVRVFDAGESYAEPDGDGFVEVALRVDRPPVRTTARTVVPANYNVIRHEGERFRVIEGRLRPGDTRDRHTHNQRLIIYLNAARLRQFPDGEPERLTEFITDDIRFSEPTTHSMVNVGDVPVRNVVIELKP